jgi:hypothetical protein
MHAPNIAAKFLTVIKRWWPIIVLSSLIAGVCIVNYRTGTWLTGWDNLHPEFDFLLNIKRSLTAVWQEYQGPGLLGGMGHAADLPRQIILWIASIIIPPQMLRYAWTFGMYLTGGIGMFMFLTELTPLKRDKIALLFGSLFYLLNFATIQMFYAPFEAFTTHFGFIPWLFYTATRAVRQPSIRTFGWFSLVTLLSLPQGYVPTMFVVYALAFGLWSIFAILTNEKKRSSLRTVAALWGITFCVNAFWLLPFIYFTAKSSGVTIHAKINQMATEEVYLKNRAFGTLADTLQLKGFWFDTFDLDTQRGVIAPILGMWRTHADKPLTMIAGMAICVVMCFGVWNLFRNRTGIWIVMLTLLCVTLLTTATPPFSWLNDLLREHVPLFAQVFRFPFTKFSLLAGFCYSVLFGAGISYILTRFEKRFIALLLIVFVGGCIAVQSYPIVTGRMFYDTVRTDIPDDYFSLFTYLKTKPASWRIANLPQSTYWGWTYTRWGYSGSGFLWYGIGQPIMDRAFDVWSGSNEQYYWELSRALYAKDRKGLERVFSKYGIRYILVDTSAVAASSNRALFTYEIRQLLAGIPAIRVAKIFGNLILYERDSDIPDTFIRLINTPAIVMPRYSWTDNDVAYGELGDYVTATTCQSARLPARQVTASACITYPFRSLFTKRSTAEREFTVTENDTMIDVSSTVVATSAAIRKTTVLRYDSERTDDLTATRSARCELLSGGTFAAKNLTENGQKILQFESNNQRGCLSYDIPSLEHKFGYIAAVETRHVTGRPLMISFINDTAKHVEVETYLDETKDVRQRTSKSWQTDYFILPPLASDGLGYSIYLTNDSIGDLPTVNEIRSIRIYKIPYEEMVDQKQVSSIKYQVSRNTDNNLSVEHPNAAYYRVQVTSDKRQVTSSESATLILSQSYDEGWKAWEINTNNPIIKLSNNPMKTWLFETIPFLFGTEIKEHVMVNNWANAWLLPSEQESNTSSLARPAERTIVLFFWPQMLEYLGFVLLPVPFLFLLRKKKVA